MNRNHRMPLSSASANVWKTLLAMMRRLSTAQHYLLQDVLP